MDPRLPADVLLSVANTFKRVDHARASDCMVHESFIDLTLAVNYLPACACLVQTVGLSACLCMIHGHRLFSLHVPLTLLLVVHATRDRVVRVLDCSSILFSILGSHMVCTLQEASAVAKPIWDYVHIVLGVVWALASAYVMINPVSHKFALRLAFFVSCSFVSTFAFHRSTRSEPHSLRGLRDVSFAL